MDIVVNTQHFFSVTDIKLSTIGVITKKTMLYTQVNTSTMQRHRTTAWKRCVGWWWVVLNDFLFTLIMQFNRKPLLCSSEILRVLSYGSDVCWSTSEVVSNAIKKQWSKHTLCQRLMRDDKKPRALWSVSSSCKNAKYASPFLSHPVPC